MSCVGPQPWIRACTPPSSYRDRPLPLGRSACLMHYDYQGTLDVLCYGSPNKLRTLGRQYLK